MSGIYLDSSAIIKLFIEEPETAILRDWLARAAEVDSARFVTSELARVEVIGKLNQLAVPTDRAASLFQSLILIPIKKIILDYAINSRALGLKTLDAIHHSTAIYLTGSLSSVVCFDKQLSMAFAASGLMVVSPGATEAD